MSCGWPRFLSAEHRAVLIGNGIGNNWLRFINSASVLGRGILVFTQFFKSSFVSSSKGTPPGAPRVFSHDISGGSIIKVCEWDSCIWRWPCGMHHRNTVLHYQRRVFAARQAIINKIRGHEVVLLIHYTWSNMEARTLVIPGASSMKSDLNSGKYIGI